MGFGLKLIDKSCHYEVSLLSSSHTISLVCTVVTSLDRYFAIAHPMEYQSKMTILITMGWLIGSAIGFSTLLFPQEVSKLRPVVLQRLNTTSCILVANVIKPEYLACISFGFVLPCILVTIIVYALIYRAIVNVFNSSTIKSSKRSFLVWLKMQREMEESGDIRFSEMLKIREVRATIIIFLTVIIFLLCWLPVVLILVVHKIKPIIGSLDEIFLVFTLLKIYSMINPVVYAFTLKDIRKPFVLLVKRVFCCDKNRLTTLEAAFSPVTLLASLRLPIFPLPIKQPVVVSVHKIIPEQLSRATAGSSLYTSIFGEIGKFENFAFAAFAISCATLNGIVPATKLHP
uniref:CSON000462 protein n=1 Tax=Culicoides sonorensis TaxID=179676 RepID=A0A336LPQ7_CULSO